MIDAAERSFGRSLRMPPSNLQAEQALLGAILCNNRAYHALDGQLLPEHFADPLHAKVFEVIRGIIEAGGTADMVTVAARFSEDGILAEAGGTKFIADLTAAMIGIVNAPDYARVVRDAWLRREAIAIGEALVNASYTSDPDQTGSDIVDTAAGQLNELAMKEAAATAGTSLAAAVQIAIQEGEDNLRGTVTASISTGLPSVDTAILRLRRGSLYAIGGRPGMGKTGLARTIALNVALGMGVTVDGEVIDDQASAHGVAYFALEEEDADFGAAAIAQLSGVPIGTVLSGRYTNAEASAVVKAQARLAKGVDSLTVFDRPRQSLRTITQHARALQRRLRGKLRLLVVDYLQLMADPPGIRDKRLAVGENARGLKELAKALDCAVVMLSQLGRQVDDRADRQPTMRDLRETGEIEDCSDVIMFPFRQGYYEAQARPKRDPDLSATAWEQQVRNWELKLATLKDAATLIVPKVRRGRAPVHVDLHFDAERTRFGEAARGR